MTSTRIFLMIDDDKDDRELFQEALTAVAPGIHCYFAEDAEDALNKLKAREIIPDLVFVDINLPGMSGWNFLTTITANQQLNHIPVIMYSTSPHQRDKDIAKDLGAVYFITKPSNFKVLIKILDTVIVYSEKGDYEGMQKRLAN